MSHDRSAMLRTACSVAAPILFVALFGGAEAHAQDTEGVDPAGNRSVPAEAAVRSGRSVSDTLSVVITEQITVSDSISTVPVPVVSVNELVQVTDAPDLRPATMLSVLEPIHVTDLPLLNQALLISLEEPVSVQDSVLLMQAMRLAVTETIFVNDEPALSCSPECDVIARTCEIIDFESVPGADVVEGLEIHRHFEASLGISFALEDETFPHIAQVGQPTTAFEPNDTPNDPSTGSFFLTDDGELSGSETSPLIVTFTHPVDSASGVLLDIDFSETFEISALGSSGDALERISISAGDEGTGDAAVTPWSFSRSSADVFSIRIAGMRSSGRFGLGFDNFITCAPNRATSIAAVERPAGFVLKPNYPNPFNPSTMIGFSLSETVRVRLVVFDLLGREVEVLMDGMHAAGNYMTVFDAGRLPSGTYFYRLEAGTFVQTRSMLLVR